MKKIVIFASGDVDALVRRLKIGTPDLELVAGDIVTEEMQTKMKDLAPNQFEYNLPLKRDRVSDELMQGIENPKEIIVIDTKKSRKFLPVYKRSADKYSDKVSVINLTVRNGNMADHSKELFLIKGDQYEVLQKIITKVHVLPPLPSTATEEEVNERNELLKVAPIIFTGIEAESIEELEDSAITEANRADLSLITTDANAADDASRNFVTRLFGRKGFAVINIEVTQEIPEEKIEEEPVINQDIVNDSVEEKDLAGQLKAVQNGLLEKISIISKELPPGLIRKGKESLYKFSVRVLSKRLQMKPKNITEELFTQNEFRKRLFAAAEKDKHITAEERKFLENGFGIE